MKEISDEKERAQTIYGLIARLPPVNHDLLERLVFHLTRLFDGLLLLQQLPSLSLNILA